MGDDFSNLDPKPAAIKICKVGYTKIKKLGKNTHKH